MKKTLMIGIMIALLVMPITGYALGIASDYLEDSVYKIEIGTTQAEYGIRLQNMDDEQKTVKVLMGSDYNIASIRDYKDFYVLQPKTTETSIIIDINVPEDAEVGDRYAVTYSVKESVEGDAQVEFSTALSKSFIIEIVEEGEGTVIQQRDVNLGNDMTIVILGAIILLAVIFAYRVVSRKPKRTARKTRRKAKKKKWGPDET